MDNHECGASVVVALRIGGETVTEACDGAPGMTMSHKYSKQQKGQSMNWTTLNYTKHATCH